MRTTRRKVASALVAAGFSIVLIAQARAEPRDSGPAGGAFMSSYTQPPVASPPPVARSFAPPPSARLKPRSRR